MEVTTKPGVVTVLSVTGYIDAATFPQLVSEADKVLDARHVNLVIDLSGVDYVSSAGLLALQTIAGRAAARDGKAVVCCVSNKVAQVFELSGFDQLLGIFPDLTAAVASFETDQGEI